MRLAVTGASGFIGRNFLLSCPRDWEIDAYYFSSPDFPGFVRADGINAKPIGCDLSCERDVKKLAAREYDACLYLAGNSDPQRSFSEPDFDLRSNSLALINFLGKMRAGRLVYFSSGAVYDGLEGKVGPESRPEPTLPYSISKLASEYYVKFFKERGTVGSYAIIRFFGAYGPHEPERKITTKLARRFAIEKKNDFEIYGDGKNLIDFMYVSDAVRAIKLALKSKRDFTADLASNKPVSVEELVRKCAKIFGVREVKINKTGISREPIHFRSADDTFSKMGFAPEVKLEDGMRALARHLRGSTKRQKRK
ncbi:MAG: NAD(P)-dependent oxidoreductase [Candidatus Micrarchaeota archaeon]|nr:NAD(P)-dependent oxidoreductase [Candidatus Micrarchaeota archaeon]